MNFYYWKYQVVKGKVCVIYCIDGQKMGRHQSIRYMIDNHNMTSEEANDYINNLPHK